MQVTIQQFLQNPTGKYSAYFSRRDRIKADLEERFAEILKNNKGKLDFNVYKIKDNYLFHFKMPSEDPEMDIFYDVCIEFVPVDEQSKNDIRLNNYNIRLFSNSPNFTFTYTYVLYNSDMLIDMLAVKCNKKALTQEPQVRNPIESLGFEKSCYFAALYLREKRLLFKSVIEQNLSIWDEKKFLASIKTDEQKLAEYNKAKKKKTENKRKEKKKKTTTTRRKGTTRTVRKKR